MRREAKSDYWDRGLAATWSSLVLLFRGKVSIKVGADVGSLKYRMYRLELTRPLLQCIIPLYGIPCVVRRSYRAGVKLAQLASR